MAAAVVHQPFNATQLRSILLLATLLTPSVAWAHGEQVLIPLGIMFVISIGVSIILLNRISIDVTINNELAKYVVSLLLKIGLVLSLYLIQLLVVGILSIIFE